MASFRRNSSLSQRDGTASLLQNGVESRDGSPFSKTYHSRNIGFPTSLTSLFDPHMMFERLQTSVCGIHWQRSSYPPIERLRTKNLYWRRIMFKLFVFFMAGIFIGFTPLLSVNVHHNVMSKQKAFSFEDNAEAENPPFKLVRSTEEIEKANANADELVMQEEDVREASNISPYIQEPDLSYCNKLLIIVTPTYPRPFQAYYLHRLANTFKNVRPPLLWLVVEMTSQSPETARILRSSGVMYRHLVCELNATSIRDNRVHQRNVAISHVEKHQLDGILYFADDDRIYSLDLFEQMRRIRRFATWPVAMLNLNRRMMVLEGPICNGSQVIGWHTSQRLKAYRRFHVDISGFAFSSTILWDPKRWRRPTREPIRQQDITKESLRESLFIEQLVEDESQMEGLPDNCSSIMVWHLNLEAPDMFYPSGWLLQNNLEVFRSSAVSE